MRMGLRLVVVGWVVVVVVVGSGRALTGSESQRQVSEMLIN